MAQVTLYLDANTATRLRAAAHAAGTSQSRWVAELIRRRVASEWPQAVTKLAGAWPELPEAEELRTALGEDAPRERL